MGELIGRRLPLPSSPASTETPGRGHYVRKGRKRSADTHGFPGKSDRAACRMR